MSRAGRIGVVVASSMVAFAVGWWVCAGPLHLDEAVSLGIAAGVVAIVAAIGAGWIWVEVPGKKSEESPEADSGHAVRDASGANGGDSNTVKQDVTAVGSADVAARDLKDSAGGSDSGADTGTWNVTQNVNAGGDARVAGRDMIIGPDRRRSK